MKNINTITSTTFAILGREDLALSCANLNSESELNAEQKLAKTCFNLVAKRVAEQRLLCTKTERVVAKDGKVVFSDFSVLPHKIIRATDPTSGESVGFKIYQNNIKFGFCGPVDVEFAFVPADVEYGQSISGFDRISDQTMAIGVAAQYLLCTLSFEEAKLWEARFEEALDEERFLSSQRKEVRSTWNV